MANNCHFYICGICSRSQAQELEEDLNNQENFPRMWHLIVKPFERLCSIREGMKKSAWLDWYDGIDEESLDEDMVLFVAEGWKAWNISLSEYVPEYVHFLVQIEGNENFCTGYADSEYGSDEDDLQIGDGSYTCVDEATGLFGFPRVDDILSDIAPEHEKPRFKFLSEEELTDAYSDILFLSDRPQAPDDRGAFQVLGGNRRALGMRYLNDEIVSQLENLSGEICFVFSNSQSGFHAAPANEDDVRALQTGETQWFCFADGDIVFAPAPSNGSALSIGGTKIKFSIEDWNNQERNIKITNGETPVIIWDGGFGDVEWDGYFYLVLKNGEKFSKDKLTWKTINFYDETETLLKTIVCGAVYDGKEYPLVRNLPNNNYGPGEPTWLVPYKYKVPDDIEIETRQMEDPSITEDIEYNSHRKYDLALADYEKEVNSFVWDSENSSIEDPLEEGVKFYQFMLDGGDYSDYDPDEDYVNQDGSDDEETASDDTPPAPTTPPAPEAPAAPTPPPASQTSAPTSSNPLADMNADLKKSLEESQAALKKQLEDSQNELKKSLNDALNGLKI